MKLASTLNCEQHKNIFECPDVLINYIPKFNEYGIIIHDGGSAILSISYCPFCGKKLPESKRDLWFEQLEKLGFENPSEEEIPKEYSTNEWYKNL